MQIFDGQGRANFWNSQQNKWSFMQSLYAWPVINNDAFGAMKTTLNRNNLSLPPSWIPSERGTFLRIFLI